MAPHPRATPLAIGPVRLATNLLLAPIAGYCDLAFRTTCREQGAVGLACTDLLSPQGLLRGSATSLDLARTNPADKPIGMQLYGSDPDIMAQGARWAVEHGATVVDINMGCPVDKVTKKDGGSKLLTDLTRAVNIAKRVVQELEKCPLYEHEWAKRLGKAQHSAFGTSRSAQELAANVESPMPSVSTRPIKAPVPLTCKMRLCWHTADYNAGQACSPHLARMLADVGVAAVTVHGRTTEMKFSGEVIRPGIARVVEAVDGRIPVIGNGDIRTPADARRMLDETGCQGLMIGRAALAAPWLFREIWHELTTGTPSPQPTHHQKLAVIRRYFHLMRTFRDDRYALVHMRKRISWFAKHLLTIDPDSGRPVGCRPLKEAVRLATDAQAILDALDQFEAGGLRSLPGLDAEPEDAAAA